MTVNIHHLYKTICCLHKDKEQNQQETSLLRWQLQESTQAERLAVEQCSAAQKENEALAARAEDLTQQAKLAREEAERLAENNKQKEEFDGLIKKLYAQKQWGEATSPTRPVLLMAGAAIGGSVGWFIALVVSYAYEIFTNKEKHLSSEYFKDLFETESNAHQLADRLKIDYPKDLKEAWWTREATLVHSIFGRNFGFQDSHRKQYTGKF